MHPLKTFIIYSSKDKTFREELESHLQILIDDKLIELWSDKQILPGEAWDAVIKQKLHESELILLLVSIDLYGSDYIRNEEFKIALDRLQSGKAIVVPIIVRACLWNRIPVIKDLQVLPEGGQAVGDEEVWKNRDKAWHHVAVRLVEMIEKKFSPPSADNGEKNHASPKIHSTSQPVYSLIKNPTPQKITLEKGVYSNFTIHPNKPAMYLCRHREILDFSNLYDLVYVDLSKSKSYLLADLGTDNYNLDFHADVLYTTTSVKEFETHKLLAFQDTRKITTPYDNKIFQGYLFLKTTLVYEVKNKYYYLDVLGKERRIDFLDNYSIHFVHSKRNLLIVSQDNQQIKSKYKSKWEHPQAYFLLEYYDDMTLASTTHLLDETNSNKYQSFTEWGDNDLLFLQATDENGDGLVTYEDKDNKQLLTLNLDTLELNTLTRQKFSIQGFYGLNSEQVFMVDETEEDALYTGLLLHLKTSTLTRCFQLTGGAFTQFQFNHDYTRLYFKKILPDPKKGTFYDWENESEIYEMTFAEFIGPA